MAFQFQILIGFRSGSEARCDLQPTAWRMASITGPAECRHSRILSDVMRRTFIEVSADCTIHSGVQRCFEAFRSAIKIHTSSGIDIRSTTVSETRLTLARVPERMILLYPRRARAIFRITDFEGINAGLPNYYSRAAFTDVSQCCCCCRRRCCWGLRFR